MSDGSKRVRLVIPAAVEFVLLARLTVAGFGSRLGLPYDEVEDLRVMVTEACRLLIGENGAHGEITFTCTAGDGNVVIEAEADVDPLPPAPDDDDLALHLLAVLADDHTVEIGSGGPGRVRISKALAS